MESLFPECINIKDFKWFKFLKMFKDIWSSFEVESLSALSLNRGRAIMDLIGQFEGEDGNSSRNK